MDMQAAPIRPVRLGNMTAEAEHRADGSTIVRSVEMLCEYPRSIVDALECWAEKTPDTVLIADRLGDGSPLPKCWRAYSRWGRRCSMRACPLNGR